MVVRHFRARSSTLLDVHIQAQGRTATAKDETLEGY